MAVWRKRREDKIKHGRRGLFAWRMDRRHPAVQVPWAGSPDQLAEGRPTGGMPIYLLRPLRWPNSDSARFCSNCGTQLAETGTMAAVPGLGARPGETTSTLSLNRSEDADFGDDLFPDSASLGALPEGSALLLVMRGPNAGSRFRLDGGLTTAGRHPEA